MKINSKNLDMIFKYDYNFSYENKFEICYYDTRNKLGHIYKNGRFK